jgi:very-short-patch-repair endonuclease
VSHLTKKIRRANLATQVANADGVRLPHVCAACRNLKLPHLGSFQRRGDRTHDRRWICHSCQATPALRNHAGDRDRRPTSHERQVIAALATTGRRFTPQYQLGGYVFDVFVPELRLLLEIDGASHRWPRNRAKDRAKDRVAHDYGYVLTRLTTDHADVAGAALIAVDRRAQALLDACAV